jgi:hypothetical protein
MTLGRRSQLVNRINWRALTAQQTVLITDTQMHLLLQIGQLAQANLQEGLHRHRESRLVLGTKREEAKYRRCLIGT